MEKAAKQFAQRIIDELGKIRHALSNAPLQQDKTGTSPQDTATQKDNAASGEPAAIPKVDPAPSNTDQSKHPWYKTVQGWKSLLEVVAIPFAIGYAVVTFQQWHDLRHNFEVEERAWLKIDYAVPDNITSNAAVEIRITNIGKSVALRGVADTMLEIVDSKNDPSFEPVAYHYKTSLPPLFPADKQTFTVTRTPNNPDGSPRPLTGTELQGLTTGHSYLAVYGRVVYLDQFGMHWTRYCTWHSYAQGPNANSVFSAGACVNWNAVGDGRPSK